MLVVVGGTSLAKIFEHPGLPLAIVDVGFRCNPSKITQLSEADIRSRSTTQKDWGIRVNMFGVKALEMGVDNTIHRAAKRLASLDAAIRQADGRSRTVSWDASAEIEPVRVTISSCFLAGICVRLLSSRAVQTLDERFRTPRA